ncbi:serine/threonine protein kinase [Streptomyces sp. SAT1]|uniref:serine/threonine-protein kinase n=1 Tax=Streptomyces sp. SAT1 TaxID=1849967 RepID=UPI0007DD2AC2|nr:serine/threonine-protein kinase [Streptomyces sp. SAT1]ANH92438.1 serine/threonine protein kinase [Streptomyces sp. SAT1]
MGEVFAGRYELADPIGRGGVGAVWRAWDHRRRRYVAAKVLQQSDAHSLLRFVREQALRIDHPHVLAPASWAADDDKVLFTMDLVAGGSLVHLVGDYGPLPPRFVCVLLDQLLAGLAAVHSEGVVHRDIKPANILLEATGTARPRLRLSDFGVAMRLGEPRLTETDLVVGTPGYLAPEQMMGADPDFPADLFATGLVALYLLQGARPDTRALVEHFAENGTPGAPQGIPEPLWQVVAGLLEPDPRVRFRTATGARKALASALELLPPPGPDDEPIEIFDQLGPLPPDFGPAGPPPRGPGTPGTLPDAAGLSGGGPLPHGAGRGGSPPRAAEPSGSLPRGAAAGGSPPDVADSGVPLPPAVEPGRPVPRPTPPAGSAPPGSSAPGSNTAGASAAGSGPAVSPTTGPVVQDGAQAPGHASTGPLPPGDGPQHPRQPRKVARSDFSPPDPATPGTGLGLGSGTGPAPGLDTPSFPPPPFPATAPPPPLPTAPSATLPVRPGAAPSAPLPSPPSARRESAALSDTGGFPLAPPHRSGPPVTPAARSSTADDTSTAPYTVETPQEPPRRAREFSRHRAARARRPGPPTAVAITLLLLALACYAVGLWALFRL